MTQFAVAPPTALFGAIRAEDKLTVHFDLAMDIAPENNDRRMAGGRGR